MKSALRILLVVMVVATSVTVSHAQPPVEGTYKSTDLGGLMLVGRSSHSWTSSPDGRLSNGNVGRFLSWDGGTLGTQWSISCLEIVNVALILDAVFGGNGQRIYQITYASGGALFLDGAGPWGGGDPTYDGVITQFSEFRTLQYAGGVLTGANSSFNGAADILGYTSSCIALGIGNDALVGDTDCGTYPPGACGGGFPLPAGYPAFLDPNCDATPSIGRWGTTTAITLNVVGCAVPTKESTWGDVKSHYGE